MLKNQEKLNYESALRSMKAKLQSTIEKLKLKEESFTALQREVGNKRENDSNDPVEKIFAAEKIKSGAVTIFKVVEINVQVRRNGIILSVVIVDTFDIVWTIVRDLILMYSCAD